jgi:hypothetical protein
MNAAGPSMNDAQVSNRKGTRRRLARLAGALCAVWLVAAILLVTTWVSSYGQVYRVSLTWFGPCELELTQGHAIFTRYVAIGSGDDDDDGPTASASSGRPITWERHLPGIWFGQGDKGHGVAYRAIAVRHWLLLAAVICLFLVCFRFSRRDRSASVSKDESAPTVP